jgi:8-oxo-dGTP pyrophosphatase MutT (NUDIX family)
MTIEIRDQTPVEHDPADDPHREALDETGFFGRQAAGALILAASTGRIMTVLRSKDVLEPFTWGGNGGAHFIEEKPEDAALREVREETGWNGSTSDISIIPAYVFKSGTFVYRNFIAVVPDEYTPLLGWEATEHRWSSPDQVPDPLHFGIKALLADPESRAIIDGGWRDIVANQSPRFAGV